jgi:hypothetical protein
LTGFEKRTIFETFWFFILHLWGPIGEKKYFWIIDWFQMVDFLYLIPPNDWLFTPAFLLLNPVFPSPFYYSSEDFKYAKNNLKLTILFGD